MWKLLKFAYLLILIQAFVVVCRADESSPTKELPATLGTKAEEKGKDTANVEQEADAAYERGLQAMGKKRFDRAVAEFSKAVERKPKEAKYQGMLAVAHLSAGDFEHGTAELRSAIRLHPNDAGVNYRPTSKKSLSAQDLEHGRRQVEKMLKDRPAMGNDAEETEFLRDWAIRKFAGEDLGSLIDWDPTWPLDSDAEHAAPDEKHHGSIQVHPNYTHGKRAGRPRSFEELWAGAIYELHNINNAKYFVELHRQAAEGKVKKEAFVGGIVRHEVVAAQQTRAFYLEVFLPFAAKKKLSTEPSLWFADWWDQPDEALKGFNDRSAYPWQPYARQFDWIEVDRHFDNADYEKAIPILNTMCEEANDRDDHGEIHFWLGRCFAEMKQTKKAVEEYSTAIKIDPHNAEYYRYRAKAYRQLGDNEKAESDEKTAKEGEEEAKEGS